MKFLMEPKFWDADRPEKELKRLMECLARWHSNKEGVHLQGRCVPEPPSGHRPKSRS